MKTSIISINNAIRTETTQRKIDLQAFGLAESIFLRGRGEGDGDFTIPAFVLPDGECFDVFGQTDKHDVVLYHRLNNKGYQEDSDNAFGSGKSYIETDDMSLIVFGKRAKISQFQMEQIACKAIGSLSACTLVSSDFNALQIYASEYSGVPFFLGPEYYLFKINYRITSTYNPRCA